MIDNGKEYLNKEVELQGRVTKQLVEEYDKEEAERKYWLAQIEFVTKLKETNKYPTLKDKMQSFLLKVQESIEILTRRTTHLSKQIEDSIARQQYYIDKINYLYGRASRDLSTPSSRIVGHWKTQNPKDKQIERYYSAVDPDTGWGSITECHHWLNNRFHKTAYKIEKETPDGESLVLMESPRFVYNNERYVEISKDGLTAKTIELGVTESWAYVDNKTKYEPEK